MKDDARILEVLQAIRGLLIAILALLGILVVLGFAVVGFRFGFDSLGGVLAAILMLSVAVFAVGIMIWAFVGTFIHTRNERRVGRTESESIRR